MATVVVHCCSVLESHHYRNDLSRVIQYSVAIKKYKGIDCLQLLVILSVLRLEFLDDILVAAWFRDNQNINEVSLLCQICHCVVAAFLAHPQQHRPQDDLHSVHCVCVCEFV